MKNLIYSKKCSIRETNDALLSNKKLRFPRQFSNECCLHEEGIVHIDIHISEFSFLFCMIFRVLDYVSRVVGGLEISRDMSQLARQHLD